MAEVRKKDKIEKYEIDDTQFNNEKEKKIVENKKVKKENNKSEKEHEKKGLWTRFRIFCHGVKLEALKVHWPSKKDMLKYSIATVVFIVFCSLFFYLIEIIFALIQSIFK